LDPFGDQLDRAAHGNGDNNLDRIREYWTTQHLVRLQVIYEHKPPAKNDDAMLAAITELEQQKKCDPNPPFSSIDSWA
jgi:hypothetical protein